MFRRQQPPDQPSGAQVAANLDKVLPVIPFTPDWSDPAKPEPNEPSVFVDGANATTTNRSLPLVILAEADPTSRDLISSLCREWGYEVRATSDGAAALAAFRETSGAAIALVNREMGGMTGIDFCRAVHAAEKPLYIILVTERSETAELAMALSAGADDFLINPFDADELRARMRIGAQVISLQADLAAGALAFEALAARE